MKKRKKRRKTGVEEMGSEGVEKTRNEERMVKKEGERRREGERRSEESATDSTTSTDDENPLKRDGEGKS